MRLVFENIDFTSVGHMQSILEAEGIRTAGAPGIAGEVLLRIFMTT